MKKTKRGAKQFFVAMLAIMLVVESVSVPARGEVKDRADAQEEMISEQTLSKSVEHDTEDSVSANFVSIEEIEVSANTVKKEEMKKEDEETDAEMTASVYSGIDGDLEWNIDSEGCLTVNGQGDFDGFPAWLGYGEKIKRAKINVKDITSMNSFFMLCKNLEEVSFVGTDASQVTDMSRMFYACENLTEVSLEGMNTSNVTIMNECFSGCKALEKVNLKGWDTKNLLAVTEMFRDCESLTELDISDFELSKLYCADKMFYNCIKLKSINWKNVKMSELKTVEEMFYNCKELEAIDVSKMNTSNVTSMKGMFYGCQKIKELNVSGFDTSHVSNMIGMFTDCYALQELDISNFDTTSMRQCGNMFSGCHSLKKIDVSHFEMSKVLDTSRMFMECKSLKEVKFAENQDLGKVYSMESMFEGCTSLDTIEMSIGTVSLENVDYMFKDCRSLTSLNGIHINGYSLQRAKGMFQGCSGLEDVTVPFGTDAVTDLKYMFKGCTKLKYLNMCFIGVRNVKYMDEAFAGCSNLIYVRLPVGTPLSLESMRGLFSGCASIEQINLSNFGSNSADTISEMFSGCTNLKTVSLGDFKGKNIESMYRIFAGCRNLQSVDLTGIEVQDDVFIRDIFDGCTNLINISVSPEIMQGMVGARFTNFTGCELLSDIYLDGTLVEWSAIKPAWEECKETKLRYAAVHLNDGTIEQTLQHEGRFQYIKQGGFGTQAPTDYVYNCDLSQFFGTGYNYNHNLGQMSIRVAMAAMSDNTNVNSSNIRALMDDLNLSKKKISYPKPEYNTIGYAMGTRRIYHNNQKKTLIMVAIRGGGYGAEWGGNANVGAGGEHEGFDLAANQVYWALNDYIGELKECNFIEGRDVVVWISGYSRGAATANLLASKLDDNYYMRAEPPKNAKGEVPEEHIMDVQASNVYAYCFECPQNTTNNYNNHSRYMNIYNIINPKDFVTYVAMNNGWDWRFNRYGKDLVLPDEANMREYATYKRRVELVYQAGTAPEIGANQSTLVKDISKQFANLISKDEYVWWHQEQVQPILVSIMCKQLDLLSFYKEYIKLLVNYNHTLIMVAKPQFDILLADIAFVNKGIMHAHYPELCMAWMDSIPEEILLKQKSYRNVFVNCPVDIYVYEDENLIGCIKNDVPQQIENGVITMLDSNGQKQVVLPGDGEYKVVYKATGDGTMTISTSKYIQTGAIPESVTGYYELPLKAGETYEAMITGSNFVLTDSTKTTVNPSVVQTGAEVKTYKVDITVQGNGEATGINTYSVGEFAKVCAHPNEGEKFLGWYENETLISSETEYRFCVKKDTTLTAKFSQNLKPDEKEEQSVAAGTCYTVNKHTYKITNLKKKTVSFVKTASKSKTIKIPATVTIQGTKYKVTSIAANALKGNKKVTKVTIGKNVTSIGKKAFYKCTSLKTITIPSKVKTIGESAFSGCKKLTKATVGKGVTKIGKKAFYNCKKLKSVTLKTTKLKSVGKYALKGIAKQAIIKCPAKKLKKYRKMFQKSKLARMVQFK